MKRVEKIKRTVLCMLALALSLLLVACSPTDAGAFTVDSKTLKEGRELTLKERRVAKVYFYRAK